MRTTLTLDEPLVTELKTIARETDRPFKQVVNETLSLGLKYRKHLASRAYQVTPVKLGSLHSGVDLDKTLQLADMLEDEAILAKLAQRK